MGPLSHCSLTATGHWRPSAAIGDHKSLGPSAFGTPLMVSLTSGGTLGSLAVWGIGVSQDQTRCGPWKA